MSNTNMISISLNRRGWDIVRMSLLNSMNTDYLDPHDLLSLTTLIEKEVGEYEKNCG